MPRVKPMIISDADRRAADQQRRHDAVVADLQAGTDVDAAYSRNDLRTPSGLSYSVKENSFYGDSSHHSWFRDLALSAAENVEGLDALPHPTYGGAEDA